MKKVNYKSTGLGGKTDAAIRKPKNSFSNPATPQRISFIALFRVRGKQYNGLLGATLE